MGFLDFKEDFFRTTFRRIFFLRGGIIKVCEACVEIITLSVEYTYFSSNFLGDSLLGVVCVIAEWVDDEDLAAADRKRVSVEKAIKLCRMVTHCAYLCKLMHGHFLMTSASLIRSRRFLPLAKTFSHP